MKKIKKSLFSSLITSIKQKFFQKNTEIFAASIAFAFVFSFSLIGLSRVEIQGNSLLASVSNVHQENMTKNYGAQIVLKNNGKNLSLIAGNDMQKVDSIEWVFAIDPTRGVEISLKNGNLEHMGGGMYRFVLLYYAENISKGTIIAEFEKNIENNISIMLTDTQFVSEGNRYNLTNLVE